MYEALREHLDSAVLTLAESKGSKLPNALIESRITSIIFYKAAIELIERFNNGQINILEKLPENVRRSLLTPNCMMSYEHWLDAVSLLHLELERIYYNDPSLMHESLAEIHFNSLGIEKCVSDSGLNQTIKTVKEMHPKKIKRETLTAPFSVFKRFNVKRTLHPITN